MKFLRVSGRKNCRFFLVGPFFFIYRRMFIEVPQFEENSPALKKVVATRLRKVEKIWEKSKIKHQVFNIAKTKEKIK